MRLTEWLMSSSSFKLTLRATGAILLTLSGLAFTDIDIPEALSPSSASQDSWLESVRQDAFLIESEDELDQLLGLLLSRFPDRFVAYIQQPADLDEDELINAISVTDGHHAPLARPALMPGKLFSDNQVILVIDFRAMAPARIAEFNELYDQPPRLRGRELGDNVRIIAITSKAMMGSGEDTNRPGSDFWRRITSPDNHWRVEQLYNVLEATRLPLSRLLDRHVIRSSALSGYFRSRPAVEIDFPYYADWRYAMQGGLSLDESAAISHVKGPVTAGREKALFILKSAPWHDTRFKVRLANMMINCGFEQYNECYWTKDFVFYAEDSEPLQIQRLARTLRPASTSQAFRLFPVNERNLDGLLASVSLDDSGQLARGDLFEKVLREYEGLRVSAPLSEPKWKQLVKHLEQRSATVPLQALGGNRQPIELPEEFRGAGAEIQVPDNLRIVLTPDEKATLRQLRTLHPGAFEASILPDTSPLGLLLTTEVRSELESRFSTRPTPFLQSLRYGDTTILTGLNRNTDLQYHLESLLADPPSVSYLGVLEPLQNPKIWIVWPCGVKAESLLWQSAISQADAGGCDKPVMPAFEETTSLLTREQLNLLLSAVTRSLPENAPFFPEDALSLWHSLLPLAELEMQMENLPEITYRHLRKAAERLYLPPLMEQPDKYDRLSVQLRVLLPDPGPGNWIDVEWLADIANAHPVIDQAWIRQNFWHIARGISPALLGIDSGKLFKAPDSHALEMTMSLLVQQAPEQWQPVLTELIPAQPSINLSKSLLPVQANAWPDLSGDQIALLLQAIRNNPIVYLEGPPGSGKSYSASQAASILNPDVSPVVVTAGPHTDMGQLYGEQKFQARELNLSLQQLASAGFPPELLDFLAAHSQDPDPDVIRFTMDHDIIESLRTLVGKHNADWFLSARLDQESHFSAGPIKHWAELRSDKPVVLIIDEANMAARGQWDIFAGLGSPEPFISFNGEITPVTPMHRVIMTGNPPNFPGRKDHGFIRNNALKIPFHSYSPGQLREQILNPALASLFQTFDTALTEHDSSVFADAIMDLYGQYRQRLPLHPFSPRDLLEVISRVSTSLQIRQEIHGTATSLPALNGSLWQAFQQALGSELDPGEDLSGLESWFAGKYVSSSLITETVEHHFNKFYSGLKHFNASEPGISRNFDLDNASTRALARTYWLELMRVEHEIQSGTRHSGRHGVVIEGPPGRGKDALLNLVWNFWRHGLEQKTGHRPEALRVNAGKASWDTVAEAIIRAKSQGHILMVSELNLLPSQYLEGKLNDLLSSGDARAGFYLFATVNPVEFNGRHSLSPALESRFTRIRLEDYTLNDFASIAFNLTRQAGLDRGRTEKLARWHVSLRELCRQKGTAIPTASTFTALLAGLNGATPPAADKALFEKHYWLYLQGENIDQLNNHLSEPSPAPETQHYQALQDWLHKQVPGLESPLTIIEGLHPDYDPASGRLSVIAATKDSGQLQKQSVMAIARQRAHRLGLTVDSGTLSYGKSWEILQRPESVLIQKELDSRKARKKKNEKQLTTRTGAIKTRKTGNTGKGKKVTNPEAGSVAGSEQDSEYSWFGSWLDITNWIGGVVPEHRIRADASTSVDGDFSDQDQVLKINKRFTSDFPAAFYRLGLKKMVISESGHVSLVPLPPGQAVDYEPDSVQTDLSRSLQPGQHYGIEDIYSGEQLTSLFPREKLVGIWTEDNMPVRVQYDPSRGLYSVILPDAADSQKTRVHFVVEEDKSEVVQKSLLPLEEYQAPAVWLDRLSVLLKEKPSLAYELGDQEPLTLQQRMERIIAYVQRFTAPPRGVMTLDSEYSNVDRLAELIEKRIGTCRHLAFTAAALAQYYSIPVRILFSEIHAWVEYSLDNGQTWKTSETWGTYGNIENPEDFGDPSLISGGSGYPSSSVQTDIAYDSEAETKAVKPTGQRDKATSADVTTKNCRKLTIGYNPLLWAEPGSTMQADICQTESVNNVFPELMRQAYEAVFTDDGELILKAVPIEHDLLRTVEHVSGKPAFITPDQYYEKVTLHMLPGLWYRLPAALRARDVEAVWTKTGQSLQLAFEPGTGFYLVGLPEGEWAQTLEVHYLLGRVSPVFFPEKLQDFKSIPGAMEEVLNALPELSLQKKSWREMSLLQRIDSLESRFRQFTHDASRVLPKETPLQTVAALFSQNAGNSFLRATLFAMALEDMNVRTRILAGEVHAIAEFSLDNGEHWITMRLDHESMAIISNRSATPFKYALAVSAEYPAMAAQYVHKYDWDIDHPEYSDVQPGAGFYARDFVYLPEENEDIPQFGKTRLWESILQEKGRLDVMSIIWLLNISRMEKAPNPWNLKPSQWLQLTGLTRPEILPYLKNTLLALISPPAHGNQVSNSYFLVSLLNEEKNRGEPWSQTWQGIVEYILLEQQWLNASQRPEEILKLAKAGSKHRLLRAELDKLYQRLTQKRRLSSAVKEKAPDAVIIPELQQLLFADGLDIEWQQFPEGAPDASRLIRRQPAFRKTTDGRLSKSRPVVMLIKNHKLLNGTFDGRFNDKRSPGDVLKAAYENERSRIILSFLRSLLQTVETELWFLSQPAKISEDYGLISPGSEEQLEDLIDKYASERVELLSLPMLLKHADMTDAVVIDDSRLESCFNSFMDRNPELIRMMDENLSVISETLEPAEFSEPPELIDVRYPKN